MELEFKSTVKSEQIEKVLTDHSIKGFLIQKTGDKSYFIKFPNIEKSTITKIKNDIKNKIGDNTEKKFETVGPSVSKDLTIRSYWSVGIASLFIILFIAYAFRKIPKPANSFRFGVSAVIALIHDSLLVLGLFAFLGRYYGVEIDSMFITAILTVLGFSVHDTIVVFDRIRENLMNNPDDSFDENAGKSLIQTIDRSLNTSLTVMIVLGSLLIFGGESIRWFNVALLAGVFFGTYSSIFVATQFLSYWQKWVGNKDK